MEVIKVNSRIEIPDKFTGIAEHRDGTKEWYLNGQFHREDGPAIEFFHGSKIWYLYGKYHREDGPAIEYSDGIKYWFLNGKRVSSMEIFEKLTPEQKEKVIWNLDEWR